MKSAISIIGLGRATKQLKSLVSEEKIKKLVKQTALYAEREAKREAPVDTGRLRASISHRFENGGLVAYVFTNVRYAPFAEYGTRFWRGKPFLRPAAIRARHMAITFAKAIFRR